MIFLHDPDDLPPNLDGPSRRLASRTEPLMRAIARYHRHRVEGIEHVPASGAALLVINHSLATYDGVLLGMAIDDATGRLPCSLGDDLIFRTPGVRHLGRRMGIVPASNEHGVALLERGRLVAVAPGGMREALRPSSERYRVRWDKRQGFIRLALRTATPLVLAGCRGADDLFTVYETPFTKLAYKYLKVPIPLIRGIGPTWLPRPVPLVHRIAPLVVPPPYEPDREQEQIDALHAEVMTTMQALLAP